MKVGSLFSGIGGLDLGLERAGMTVVWQSEIDAYASRVLARHWPDVPNLGDITTIDWSTVDPVDLICGGYPCQPFSLAGSRAGESDARHLWPYFADAIRELRPRWALLENVPGHLSMGFGRVLGDLAELGYDADWDCIPAAAVGAPHLRYRVFVVASDADSERLEGSEYVGLREQSERRDLCCAMANPNGCGFARFAQAGRERREIRQVQLGHADADGRGQWLTEPDVGRVAHGIPSRVDRLKCLGNAVVPQVAEYVGRRIMQATP